MSTQTHTSGNIRDALSAVDIERKANDVVCLMLLKEQGKIPVKRADIIKHVLPEHRNAYNKVMERAAVSIQKTFGLEIVTVGEGTKKCYMLRNLFSESSQMDIIPVNDKAKKGLLMVILSLIFMSGNVLTNSQLWDNLLKLGIDPTIPHNVFGDVKKLVTGEFVRQMYLETTKHPNTDPPQYDIRWGQRTFVETSKLQVLKFVTKVYGKNDIKVWRAQYEDATKVDEVI